MDHVASLKGLSDNTANLYLTNETKCTIIKIQITNLFAWSVNSRSAHRQQIRIILERLDKKIGYVVAFFS